MAAGFIAFGLVVGLFYKNTTCLMGGVICVVVVAVQWWRDIRREAVLLGDHTIKVQFNMRWGIALFIAREIMFFFSFF